LSFLFSPLAKLGALAALLLGLLVYRATLIHERDSARAAAAQEAANLAICRANTSALQNTIAGQNAAITTEQNNEKLIVQEQRGRQAVAARDQAAINEAATTRAGAHEKAAVAPGCLKAIAWFNAQVPGFLQQWDH
jgi:hypothetical protein